jgi:hypothetical protein
MQLENANTGMTTRMTGKQKAPPVSVGNVLLLIGLLLYVISFFSPVLPQEHSQPIAFHVAGISCGLLAS